MSLHVSIRRVFLTASKYRLWYMLIGYRHTYCNTLGYEKPYALKIPSFVHQQNRIYEQVGNIKVLCTLICLCCWTLKICDSVDINSISQGVIFKTAPFSLKDNDSGTDKAPAGSTSIIKSWEEVGAFDQLSKLLFQDNVLTIIHVLWGGVSADPANYQLYWYRLHDDCFLN